MLVEALTDLVREAARTILAQAGAKARWKHDGSPVTAADEASEALLLAGLSRLWPGMAVVSEEQACRGALAPAAASFVLIDPLDGTREFIAGLPEYTVNLAVVSGGTPIFGIVAAPALGAMWRGLVGAGAERLEQGRHGAPTAIKARRWPQRDPVAVVSRSHLDAQTAALLRSHPELRAEVCGSSLKFCRLAEGQADIYPRLAPTSEWDIAAGHAILASAGGTAMRPDGSPLAYGQTQAQLCVPAFLALGDPAQASHFAAAAL